MSCVHMKNHSAFESVYFFFSLRDLMTLSLKVVLKNKIKVLEKKGSILCPKD